MIAKAQTCTVPDRATECPRCGLIAEGVRCPRCNALKLKACDGSCASCALSKMSK